jgi:hypothetical protein
MSDLALLLSDANKDDNAWVSRGKVDDAAMAKLLHSKRITKFEVERREYSKGNFNITCVMTFANGDKLHVYSQDFYRLDYHRIGNR